VEFVIAFAVTLIAAPVLRRVAFRLDIVDRPGARALGRIDGRLDLDGIVFAYGDEPVIHGLDLEIPVGGCIALVGESGGGKSTTAKLVARFYDPGKGAVRVDGTDLRDVRLRSYRRQLGVVLQDPFLFSGTIADNIRFGRPDATDEEIVAAARAIGVDRVAARFEEGLDHVVREGGAGLSAGERQLISIARALVADPRILILDEATSNIDRPTEVLIERAFDTLLEGRTSIIIAHRLTTVRRADEIVAQGHSIPLAWDGTEGGLPDGFDGLLRDAFALREAGGVPTMLSALAIEVTAGRQGRGTSRRMIEAMVELARSHGFPGALAPLRPTWKERYPLVPIERYAAWTREDGLPFDPWIRAHVRLGGRILRPEPHSLGISGTVPEWEEWTGMAFPESGDYVFPRGLATVAIDRDADVGRYWEPNVWLLHPVEG